MTTKSEEERLAVVETEVAALRSDMTEVKGDVKVLITSVQTLTTSLAVRDAVEAQHAKDRSNTGVWVRWVLPVVLTIGNAVITAIGIIKGVH
jgi:hypothetical protein